jgi:DNA polymerase-3 subunit alpha
MDNYKERLSRLSCVPLQDFETLPDGSIFRAAFVVETCQIKISSKSQKKFAILMVSDGIERFELPIWSDLFEQSSSFLVENQLLYAILQLERKEGTIHLSCRSVNDLVALDEAKVKVLDDLYDKLKAQANSESKWKKTMKPKAAIPPEKEEIKSFSLSVLIDQLRMTEVLALKDLFRQFPGKSTIELQFISQGKRLQTLFIDSQWGIRYGADFQEKFKEFCLKTTSFGNLEPLRNTKEIYLKN